MLVGRAGPAACLWEGRAQTEVIMHYCIAAGRASVLAYFSDVLLQFKHYQPHGVRYEHATAASCMHEWGCQSRGQAGASLLLGAALMQPPVSGTTPCRTLTSLSLP